jgi:hypothetical protein
VIAVISRLAIESADPVELIANARLEIREGHCGSCHSRLNESPNVLRDMGLMHLAKNEKAKKGIGREGHGVGVDLRNALRVHAFVVCRRRCCGIRRGGVASAGGSRLEYGAKEFARQ